MHTWTETPPNRGLVRVSGVDSAPFLQGLITNDINHLEKQPSMYTMFLNRQGRVLFDVVVFRENNHDYLLDCDSRCINSLVKHMKMFRLRKKIEVNPVDNLAIVVTSDLNFFRGLFWHDPRTEMLGTRAVIDANLVEKLVSKTTFYSLQRFELGIPEGIEDLPPGECFPLESNCDYLHGVSFTKGCYIGQELTARTYHTGVTRKRLMPLVFEKEVSESLAGSDILNDKKAKLGKLRSVFQNLGIGLIRVENALKANQVLIEKVKVTIKRPKWWPVELPKDIPHGRESV
ncbi:putative transferase CAF17 homolog, mitochondrial [Artemia franciscana]